MIPTIEQREHHLGDLLQCVAQLTEVEYKLGQLEYLDPEHIPLQLIIIREHIQETLRQVRGESNEN